MTPKDAPQRRVYARLLQKGPIDDRAHARKMRFEWCDTESTGNHQKMQGIMPDTIQEWHAEDALFGHVGIEKTTKMTSEDAAQRLIYARLLQKGPVDGAHWCTQKICIVYILVQKTAKMTSKDAPQRRVYARFLYKGPVDDRAHARKMRFEGCDLENTGNHQKCRKSCRIPSRNGMPRMSFLEHFGAFLEPFGAKTTKIASKYASQRRVYARSLQLMVHTDRAHARKMRFFERLVPESGQGFSSFSLHAIISQLALHGHLRAWLRVALILMHFTIFDVLLGAQAPPNGRFSQILQTHRQPAARTGCGGWHPGLLTKQCISSFIWSGS
eukprot:gene5310-biopygen23686